MIPLAIEFKTKMDAKRALVTAIESSGNPDLSRRIFFSVLRLLEAALERALLDPDSAPTFITLRVDSNIIGNPLSANMRQYLIAMGYTVSANQGAGTVTVGW